MSSKSKTNPRFEKFWSILSSREELDIPDDAKDVIFECIDSAGFNAVVATSVKGGSKKETGTKKVSGWNLFMSEKMPEVKADTDIASTERLGKIATMWEALGDDGKAAWCEEHGVSAPKPKGSKTKKSPKKADTEDVVPQKSKVPPKSKVLQKKEKSSSIDDDNVESEQPKKTTVQPQLPKKKAVVVEEEEEEEEEEEVGDD